MSVPPRSWGFRLSVTDIAVLALAVPATGLLWPVIGAMAGIIPMAVGHFFLFCNIVRIHRWKELVWAAVCLLNVGGWAACDRLWWPGILAVQTPLTVVLIATELRTRRYHGVWARRINPHLQDYLDGRG
jgi:hypothetical protein